MNPKKYATKVEKCITDIRKDLKNQNLDCSGDNNSKKESREKQRDLTIKKWSEFYGLNYSNIKIIHYGRTKNYKRERKTFNVHV